MKVVIKAQTQPKKESKKVPESKAELHNPINHLCGCNCTAANC